MLAWFGFFSFSLEAENFSKNQIKNFVVLMEKKHGFNPKDLEQLLTHTKIETRVLELMRKPGEAKPWHEYRKIFITENRINAGIAFWKKYQKALSLAEKKYQVPAEFIVAILGVETFYGKHTGGFPVLGALATLAFCYPPRAEFFKKELEEFLLLVQEENLEKRKILGSYAGAMGMPQFIPSSYRHYAVDAGSKGRRDLLQNTDDIVFSVANYFKSHGWEAGLPVAFMARGAGQTDQIRLEWDKDKGSKPKYSIGQIKTLGLSLSSQENYKLTNKKLSVLGFKQPHGTEYWLGTHNFYVITRYNRSINYAMAVYQLADKIKRGIDHDVKNKNNNQNRGQTQH